VKKSQKTHLFEEKRGQSCSRFDIAIDGLIILDLETGRTIETNPTTCRMYNYTQDEFLGLIEEGNLFLRVSLSTDLPEPFQLPRPGTVEGSFLPSKKP
jgi:PAS domain-containing protein